MRPLRLDVAGFAAFREETTVDFTGAEFFALVGPTGAGKSTVLDAICFALYGTVPRWVDRRSVANALAPSCSEARVRLVFESSGRRYAATRVVRRVGRSGTRVETTHAGLQKLPADFDPASLDDEVTELGEVLAGTPGEMEQAVIDAIGLPYEQFVTCVILPQGQFAQFLHAKGAQRQQILVNLLGLHVYERIRERAVQQQRDAEQRAETVAHLLSDVAGADLDTAISGATERLETARELAAAVDGVLPELEAAQRTAGEARQALEQLDAEVARLRAVRPPADAAELAEAVASAHDTAERAAAEVVAAEEQEATLRQELADQPDPVRLRRALDGYTERDALATEREQLAEAIATAETELAAAREALAEAERAQADAEAAVAHAQTEDLAAGVRGHLVAGEPCPVCRQPVDQPPGDAPPARLAEAKSALAEARRTRREREAAARDLEGSLTQVRAHHEQVTTRHGKLDAALQNYDGPEALSETIAGIEELTARAERASAAVREARTRHRRARATEERNQSAVRDAWRDFDLTRDGLATLAPPPAERDDLAKAWQALAEWAESEASHRVTERAEHETALAGADAEVAEVTGRLDALFTDAGLTAPASDAGSPGAGSPGAGSPGAGTRGAGTRGARSPAAPRPESYARAAAVAVERADGELRRLTDRAEQAAELRKQLAEHESAARTAKALANHLKATNFERWLLEEALDLLVDGASAILRQLSAGQYDLVHDKGEFAVVDHHDAELRRAVRTLSGGETFQASLALALALSEQLAGMSTSATSLESIVLDEGFGTLDAGTLDVVAATLENLAARGDRMVGVVTHVPALAERIPVRYEVRKDARTATVERVTG